MTSTPQASQRREGIEDLHHMIGGEPVAPADANWFDSIDPHTGKVHARAPEARPNDVDAAVAAARRAFDDGEWPRMAPESRRALLRELADRIDQEAERLGELETIDVGKPIHESANHDLPRVARNFRFFADFQAAASAETYPRDGFHVYARYEPVGVAVAISPWNFPLMLASWKIAPALAFGNTVILKPAEQSPATATVLGRLAADVLPPGVLNVLHGHGPDAAGELLVRHPGVDLVTFTGESTTGSAIMAAAAPTLKGLSLELGGKSPNIVFADADLEQALAGTIDAIFMNQGEVCLAGSRLFVERPIYEDFTGRLAQAAHELVVGDPLDPRVQVGPLVSAEHRERVESYVEHARQAGGRILTGGGRPDSPVLADGFYFEPTIVDGVSRDSPPMREEIFGPVLVAMAFDDEREAIAWANDTDYGLAGMVWTSNLRRAHHVSEAITAGLVWVNCFFVRDLRTPFGGARRSGVGREGGYSSRAFFTEAKTVTMKVS